MFYKYVADITYITKSGRKMSKHELGLALSVREKFLALFWDFCASVVIAIVYPSEIPSQLPRMLTHLLALADSASGFTDPNSSFSSCFF